MQCEFVYCHALMERKERERLGLFPPGQSHAFLLADSGLCAVKEVFV